VASCFYTLVQGAHDLLEFFTSASGIETGSDGNGAILLLGPVKGLFAEDEPDLAATAEGLAIDFAEFFVPFEGERDKTAVRRSRSAAGMPTGSYSR